MEIVRNIVVVAIAAALVWMALRPRPVFVLRIEAGRVRVARGKVGGPFLGEARRLCEEAGLPRGRIRGVAARHGIVLTFSRDIPPPVQQQLRNLWLQFS